MNLLKQSEEKEILEKLKLQYGINDLPFTLLKFGEEKVRAFTGNISNDKLLLLDSELRIENAGLYILKYEREDIRLTFDSLSILKKDIKKNIVDLTEEQAKEWLKGNEIYLKSDNGWKVLRYKDEFIGCGKSTGERITNFMPKERRIR